MLVNKRTFMFTEWTYYFPVRKVFFSQFCPQCLYLIYPFHLKFSECWNFKNVRCFSQYLTVSSKIIFLEIWSVLTESVLFKMLFENENRILFAFLRSSQNTGFKGSFEGSSAALGSTFGLPVSSPLHPDFEGSGWSWIFDLPTFWPCVLSLFSHVWLFVTLWTVAHQAPPSVGFSRQEDWSGLLLLSPGNRPHPILTMMHILHHAAVDFVCVCVYIKQVHLYKTSFKNSAYALWYTVYSILFLMLFLTHESNELLMVYNL